MPIIDPETGAYTETGRGLHPAAQTADEVDPAKLPQQGPDPYANVATRDFRNVENMSRAEMLRMGDIATSRGEGDIAQMWKSAAMQQVQAEELRQRQATFEREQSNTFVPPPNSQIVAATGTTPWSNDPEYRTLQAELAKVTATEGWQNDAELRDRAAGLNSSIAVRREAARREALEAGHWTEADKATHEANQSMAEKGARIAEMLG